jgi:hypothetical protein
MYSQDKRALVDAYINRIKNRAKRSYAIAFWAWRLDGERGDDPSRNGLSGMGAQAVRLAIKEILS